MTYNVPITSSVVNNNPYWKKLQISNRRKNVQEEWPEEFETDEMCIYKKEAKEFLLEEQRSDDGAAHGVTLVDEGIQVRKQGISDQQCLPRGRHHLRAERRRILVLMKKNIDTVDNIFVLVAFY